MYFNLVIFKKAKIGVSFKLTLTEQKNNKHEALQMQKTKYKIIKCTHNTDS